jgi:hypothetical protein
MPSECSRPTAITNDSRKESKIWRLVKKMSTGTLKERRSHHVSRPRYFLLVQALIPNRHRLRKHPRFLPCLPVGAVPYTTMAKKSVLILRDSPLANRAAPPTAFIPAQAV